MKTPTYRALSLVLCLIGFVFVAGCESQTVGDIRGKDGSGAKDTVRARRQADDDAIQSGK